VEKIMNLEKKIIQLKLEKRELILAGKSTSKIDDEIDNIKNELDKLSDIVK
jgi:ABC-type phosphate transport system auxiliary subunit